MISLTLAYRQKSRNIFNDIALVLIFLTFMKFYSCDNNNGINNSEHADKCEIHLITWFSNTPVKVRVDNFQLLNDTISSGAIAAFAAIIPVNIARGNHFLSVTIEDTLTKDTTFSIIDTLYIGVNYNSSISEISFIFQRQTFEYGYSIPKLGR